MAERRGNKERKKKRNRKCLNNYHVEVLNYLSKINASHHHKRLPPVDVDPYLFKTHTQSMSFEHKYRSIDSPAKQQNNKTAKQQNNKTKRNKTTKEENNKRRKQKQTDKQDKQDNSEHSLAFSYKYYVHMNKKKYHRAAYHVSSIIYHGLCKEKNKG